jgi:hypothetical protein
MSGPVIVLNFTTPGGQPFSLAALDANFAAVVAAVNELSTTPLLQLGAIPGVFSGYLPLTGGSCAGQISAPSLLVGPPGGPFNAVIDASNLATAAAAGIVKKAAANADVATAAAVNAPAGGTGAAAGGWDTAGHRDEAIAVINSLVTLANELKTELNALQAKLRTAGVLTP